MLYRKIKAECLAMSYKYKRDKHEYIRKVKSLHFLSNEKIPLAFRQLMDKAMEASGLTSA
jgi:hypothetical protein